MRVSRTYHLRPALSAGVTIIRSGAVPAHCVLCGGTESLRPCPKCGLALYCSRLCQVRHARVGHVREDCDLWARLTSGSVDLAGVIIQPSQPVPGLESTFTLVAQDPAWRSGERSRASRMTALQLIYEIGSPEFLNGVLEARVPPPELQRWLSTLSPMEALMMWELFRHFDSSLPSPYAHVVVVIVSVA